jgi:hypothetical protein
MMDDVHSRLARYTVVSMIAAVAGLLLVGCHANQPLGPPTPTGATILGGSTMPPPPPPPGWTQHTEIPTSQQQAQDTVLGYFQKTLNALPPGTSFDASRYSGGGDVPCTDAPLEADSPVEYSVTGDLVLPHGVDVATFIAQVGDIWKSWGWWVYERDGMYKPNRAGLPPDGYRLFIEVPAVPGPPHIIGTSPCFPYSIARPNLSFPTTITAEGG